LGALTHKPFVFQGRPWETDAMRLVDFFDIFGSFLRVEVKGIDLIKILPLISFQNINNNWITDKARFVWDALTLQRLLFPSFSFFFQKRKKIFF